MAFKEIFHVFILGFLILNVNEFLLCHGKDKNDKAVREGEEGLTNTWAVELDTDDEEVAKGIARSYGYDYGGRIGSLPMHFKFTRRERNDILKEEQEDDDSDSDSGKHEYKRVLEKHPRVKWAEQQRVLVREKQGSFE